jgi:molybdate transport system substrate-binding protein
LLKRISLVAAGIIILVAAIVFFSRQRTGKEPHEILVLCGGSMRTALLEMQKEYAKVSKDKILLTFGGSGELCAQIQNTHKGDIYVCHDPFMDWAVERDLIAKEDWKTVGWLRPVIVVPKGNPKKITGLEDLARKGLRVGTGDFEYSTCGRLTKRALELAPYGDAIRTNIKFQSKRHQEIAVNLAEMKQLDAAIIWNAIAHVYSDKVDTIPFPSQYVDAVTSATGVASDLRNIRVTVGVTRYAQDRKRAMDFFKFITGDGKRVFERCGFAREGD